MAYSLNDLANAGENIKKHFEDKSKVKSEALAKSILNKFGIRSDGELDYPNMQTQNPKYIKK